MLSSVTSQQSLAYDLARMITVGSGGASAFLITQPEITFMYPNQYTQTFHEIYVPVEGSNVRQIEVTYIASYDGRTLLSDSTGNVIRDRSIMNNPRMLLNPPREGVSGFNLRIIGTADNKVPQKVTVVANGCQRSSKTE